MNFFKIFQRLKPTSSNNTKVLCAVCEKEINGEVCWIEKKPLCESCIKSISQHVKATDESIEKTPKIETTHKNADDIPPTDSNNNSKEAELSADEAIKSLKSKITALMIRSPASRRYPLGYLDGNILQGCMPPSPYCWGGGYIAIDLRKGKPIAEVGTYPGQYGRSFSETIVLTASEFCKVAEAAKMDRELLALQSEEDWAKLFDDELKALIASAMPTKPKQSGVRKSITRNSTSVHDPNSVKIPSNFAKLTPSMGISKLEIVLDQMYSSQQITISNEYKRYNLRYVTTGNQPYNIKTSVITLSSAEAYWLERMVENTIHNPDNSTWLSITGTDRMTVVIKREKGEDIAINYVKPSNKYSDLQHELRRLIEHGSCFDTFEEIELGEHFDGEAVQRFVTLSKDQKGYYIYEYSWHYFKNEETYLSVKRLDKDFFAINTFEQFVQMIKLHYPQYECERLMNESAALHSLFSNKL